MPIGQRTPQVTTTKALALLASGLDQGKTAKAVGLDRSTINKLAKRERIAIKGLTLALIAKSRKTILDSHLKTLKLANNILDVDNPDTLQVIASLAQRGIDPKDILTLADKKEYRTLQIMGIAPSHTPSVVINQLFQDNRTQSDSQELGIVQALLESKRDNDIQEGEIVEGQSITEPSQIGETSKPR